MNKGLHSVDMAEGPLVDEFMRHLQASLDEAMDIEDKLERHERILQLEIAIQEAVIFKNRYNEPPKIRHLETISQLNHLW